MSYPPPDRWDQDIEGSLASGGGLSGETVDSITTSGWSPPPARSSWPPGPMSIPDPSLVVRGRSFPVWRAPSVPTGRTATGCPSNATTVREQGSGSERLTRRGGTPGMWTSLIPTVGGVWVAGEKTLSTNSVTADASRGGNRNSISPLNGFARSPDTLVPSGNTARILVIRLRLVSVSTTIRSISCRGNRTLSHWTTAPDGTHSVLGSPAR